MKNKQSSDARRKLLKTLVAGSGVIVAGKTLPEKWAAPVVESVLLPAHAQTSTVATVRIDNVTLTSTTLTIGGAVVPFTAFLTNGGTSTLTNVVVQSTVDQGSASRAGGGLLVNTCDPTPGVLPPGSCSVPFTIIASNTTAGSGTLVAGPATARFELIQGAVVLDTFTVPVTLI